MLTWGQTRTSEQKDKANKSVLNKQEARKRKIKAAGIDYEFDGHVRSAQITAMRTTS